MTVGGKRRKGQEHNNLASGYIPGTQLVLLGFTGNPKVLLMMFFLSFFTCLGGFVVFSVPFVGLNKASVKSAKQTILMSVQ